MRVSWKKFPCGSFMGQWRFDPFSMAVISPKLYSGDYKYNKFHSYSKLGVRDWESFGFKRDSIVTRISRRALVNLRIDQRPCNWMYIQQVSDSHKKGGPILEIPIRYRAFLHLTLCTLEIRKCFFEERVIKCIFRCTYVEACFRSCCVLLVSVASV